MSEEGIHAGCVYFAAVQTLFAMDDTAKCQISPSCPYGGAVSPKKDATRGSCTRGAEASSIGLRAPKRLGDPARKQDLTMPCVRNRADYAVSRQIDGGNECPM
jgi:hypothetical protein